MEFLNPAGLFALSLLPILLIPYLIRRRPRRIVFSSLLLLREFPSGSSRRLWGKLRIPLLFFLQLLFLLLLVLALGEPVYTIRSPQNLAIVLDNSASMQALEGPESRFDIAKEEARELIRNLPDGARVDLFITVPKPERIGEPFNTPQDALALIDRLSPYDLGDSYDDYGEILSQLTKESSYDRLFFLTDHPVQGQGERISVISVGQPQGNLAITSFHLSRASFGSSRLRARIEVTNFSSKRQRVRLTLKGGGRILSKQNQTVSPGKIIVVSFEGFPFHPHYETELEPNDALPLDNRRFALPPESRGLSILGISPQLRALGSLRSIPGITLKVILPDAYEKTTGGQRTLEIFHFSTPSVLPQSHALFILPPKENPLVSLERPVSRPVISSWRDPHPLTRYVNFALFRPLYARPLRIRSLGDDIIQIPEGALAVALERGGFRYLVLGFDPFPYLGRKNLPVSIFTLNLLGWFREGSMGISTPTGKPLQFSGRRRARMLLTPNGDEIPIKKGSSIFPRTYFQGIYQLMGGGKEELKAVNFLNNKESDLANLSLVNLEREAKAVKDRSIIFFLWPSLLLFSLFLLFLEWLCNPSAARTRYQTDSRGL
jgi:hypothetical protein